jgi:hypothetical protein
MPLPLGNWKMNMNGRESDFFIEQVKEGVFSSTLGFGGGLQPRGFWDEASQTITFGLTTQEGDLVSVALFKGYLIRTPENAPPGRDVVATLAGSVEVSVGAFPLLPLIGSSRRNVFGWFAQITEVL